MNYQEMSDYEISCKVGRKIIFADYLMARNEQVNYCNSWADAGPIIQENGIGINRDEDDKAWCAGDFYPDVRLGTWDTYKCSHYHKNPLRAAMIVFLIMKGGD